MIRPDQLPAWLERMRVEGVAETLTTTKNDKPMSPYLRMRVDLSEDVVILSYYVGVTLFVGYTKLQLEDVVTYKPRVWDQQHMSAFVGHIATRLKQLGCSIPLQHYWGY